MRLDFVVPTLNAERDLAACLQSIRRAMRPGDGLVVVDNGSADRTVEIGRALGAPVVAAPGETIGALRNIGARETGGEALAFVDADCVLDAGWRDAVERALDDPRVAATGAKYLVPDGARWIESAWFSQRRRRAGPASYINSGNLVVRRQAFSAVGGFAEDLWTGEDAELGLRLAQAGFLVFEDPRIAAVHLGNPKTLRAFYRKQRWHAAGMLGTFRRSWWDKPLVMTCLFGASLCAGAALLPLTARGAAWGVAAAALVCWAPAACALYRAAECRDGRRAPALFVLYAVYLAARLSALAGAVLAPARRPRRG
ncbi:glycosyltransferase [bacterium]|nr:glycosyltransferase [bacterium]